MDNDFMGMQHNTFTGIPIIESPHLPEFTPVIQLSHKINVSDEFRAKTDAWYLEIFGQNRTMYMMNGNYVMHPNTLRAMKTSLSRTTIK